MNNASGLKILIATEDLPSRNFGGLGRHVVMLMNALVRRGHVVDLIGSNRMSLAEGMGTEKLPGRFFPELVGTEVGWKERRLGVWMPGKREWLGRSLARAIAKRAAGYDVVHYHGHVPEVAAHIPERINFVQTRHDQGSECIIHVRYRDGAICTETDPRACASCIFPFAGPVRQSISGFAVRTWRDDVARGFLRHQNVFVSDFIRRNFVRTMGGDPERWGVVIHHFISVESLKKVVPLVSANRFRLEVFVAGKIFAAKGIESFLDAFVPRMPADARVTIAGDGQDAARLGTRFGGDRIRFVGWRSHPEVLARVAASDVVVMPSVCEESFGSSTMEALALNRPVYALARGGTLELDRYARYPDQLRLFGDHDGLAAKLSNYDEPIHELPTSFEGFAGDVRFRVLEIEAAYRRRIATATGEVVPLASGV